MCQVSQFMLKICQSSSGTESTARWLWWPRRPTTVFYSRRIVFLWSLSLEMTQIGYYSSLRSTWWDWDGQKTSDWSFKLILITSIRILWFHRCPSPREPLRRSCLPPLVLLTKRMWSISHSSWRLNRYSSTMNCNISICSSNNTCKNNNYSNSTCKISTLTNSTST